MRSESAKSIQAMLSLARSDNEIQIPVAALDANPWAFNVQNGTLDLRTGELLPHDPSDLITKISTMEYDRSATCPTFDAFLARITRSGRRAGDDRTRKTSRTRGRRALAGRNSGSQNTVRVCSSQPRVSGSGTSECPVPGTPGWTRATGSSPSRWRGFWCSCGCVPSGSDHRATQSSFFRKGVAGRFGAAMSATRKMAAPRVHFGEREVVVGAAEASAIGAGGVGGVHDGPFLDELGDEAKRFGLCFRSLGRSPASLSA